MDLLINGHILKDRDKFIILHFYPFKKKYIN